MGRHRHPLGLPAAFTATDAAAAGVSRGRVARAGLSTGIRGVHATRGADGRDILRAVLRDLPDGAFVMGRTAARVWGMPLPRTAPSVASSFAAGGDATSSATATVEPIEIGVPPGRRAPRRAGVVARAIDTCASEIIVRGGVRTTSPERTFLDLAGLLELPDLVAAGDRLIGVHDEISSIGEVAAVLEAHPRVRGTARARRGLALLSPYAESPQESRLRVVLVEAGLPHPLVNEPVYDEGRFVARVDLLFARYGVIVEYEGRQHADDPVQWRRDLTRIGRLQALGYVVERAHAGDVAAPAELISRLTLHLTRRGWRSRR